jgi:predicted transcriptional regulator
MSPDAPELEVSYELRQLIARHLESMEQVEVLLLLARNARRAWTPAEVATELRWSVRAAQQGLDDLARATLVQRTSVGGTAVYEYAPSDTDRSTVQALLQLYDERPLLLGRLIYHRPPTVARSFADAFRIRPKREQ